MSESVETEKPQYDVVDLEKYILKLLLVDEDARDKLASFVSPAYFDESKPMMDLVRIFQSHREKYNAYPSPSEMLQEAEDEETFNLIKEVVALDDSKFNRDFLDDIAAEFFRSKMLSTHIFDMVERLKTEKDTAKLNDFPDKIREALSFSFDVKVGMDIRNDMERFYDFLHLNDKVVKTGIDELDKRIKGGIHEKTLNLFVAGCVNEHTKVFIRQNGRERLVEIMEVKPMLAAGDFVEVSSVEGFSPVTAYVEKVNKRMFLVETETKRCVVCSNDHLFQTPGGFAKAEDLDFGNILVTESGIERVVKSIDLKYNGLAVDLSVDNETHTYYTAGFSSHNTNVGKTAIKCSLAVNALLQNKKVLYVTLEMSEEKIMERIVSNIIDVGMDDLWKLSKTELGKKMYSCLKNVSSSLVVKEFPTKGANANHIRSLLKELKIKRNFVPDIIFIDYLGIMNTCSRMDGGNTNSFLQRVTEEVRGLAVESGIPIVSSSQINREGMKSSDFDMTDVADSIGQTFTADIIIGVQQTEEMLNSNLFSFKIMKNRYGGRLSRISVGIDYDHMRLINMKQDSQNDEVSDEMVDSASDDMNRLRVQDKLNARSKIIQFD